MDKKTYIKNFSNAIKWRISEQEADEILEDYSEIFSEYSDYDNLLVQKLGEPIEAARVLTEPKQYHNWLAMFTFMAICIVIPELMLLRMPFYQTPILVTSFLFVLGVLGSLIWFRTQNRHWKTIYITSLIIVFECMLIVSFLVSMEPFVYFWQMSTIYAIILGLIGLIGVILSLC